MNKKGRIKKLALIMLILISLQVISQESKPIYLNTSEHVLASKILGEDRKYIVSLPPSYENSQTDYPMAILLDGDYHVYSASTTVEVMSKEGQIPELVIVAVETKQNRTRDMTPTKSLIGYDGKDNSKWLKDSGGGTQFLNFLEKELLPEIRESFRIKNYTVFVGHSLGGLLGAEAYLENREFNSYIAIDPSFWWDDNYISKKMDTTLIKKIDKSKRFYFSGANSYANTNGMIANMRNGHELFYATLRNNGVPYTNVEFQLFEEEDHNSAPLISLYYGLKYIFKDYVLEDAASKNIEELTGHYNALSKSLGASFLPPENVVNMVAWSNFNRGERQKAYEFFNLNIHNYPTSPTAHAMLGYAYNNAGNKAEAIKCFEKALSVDPNPNFALEQTLNDLKDE